MNANELVKEYIELRTLKEQITRRAEEEVEQIKLKLDTIEQKLLEVCSETGQEGGRTEHGSFTRTVKTRYWATDWDAMRSFILEHAALELMEQRIHQSNMKQWLSDNPAVSPPGLSVDARYGIVVRRASK